MDIVTNKIKNDLCLTNYLKLPPTFVLKQRPGLVRVNNADG